MVYPQTQYKDGRCALFHWGITRRRFMLRDSEPGVKLELDAASGKLLCVPLDRRKFVDRVSERSKKYIGRLRNPLEIKLRSNFE
jgi:hypothetical protein